MQTDKIVSVASRKGTKTVRVKSDGDVIVATRSKTKIESPARISTTTSSRSGAKKKALTRGDSTTIRSRTRVDSREKLKIEKPLTLERTMESVISEQRTALLTTDDYSKSVVINGDNNIYVEGDYTPAKSYTPYSRLHRSTGHIHYMNNHSWCGCGRFHLVNWSNSSCSRLVYFRYGFRFGVSFIYPRYHRRYMFCSIGGYWPHHYRYRRYYRYGCHPSRWYGAYPEYYPSVEKKYVTYNTYNYYNEPSEQYSDESYDDIRDKIRVNKDYSQSIDDEPAEESKVDILFENAIDAFEEGNYDAAIASLKEAQELAPEDAVLPFALAQTLFASEQYTDCAVVLREIFENMPRDKETLFYPRGMYTEERLLEAQIDKLAAKTELDPFNGDLNLLLAYHQLGTGELEKVEQSLEKARLDEQNSVSIAIMEDLLETAKENEANEKVGESDQESADISK